MRAPAQLRLVRGVEHGSILDARACGVTHLGSRTGAQLGGETIALETLHSFLETRGERYSDELSSPLTGWDSCSRLSPYLAWGHVSLRYVFQRLSARQEALRSTKKAGGDVGGWLKSLAAHGSRLRWRSHFSQKLHDQPSIEFETMVRTYDALRAGPFDEVRYAAWLDGQTGYPMVDACMRSLHHTGWLNFRMRCMLVSFACYQLWLDWRRLTPAMARLFLDYEPGIHYPQFQMQAGTTGINANRIYSASKQAEDHAGPGYEFIRRWVPELKDVPDQYMAEPHLMPREVQLAMAASLVKITRRRSSIARNHTNSLWPSLLVCARLPRPRCSRQKFMRSMARASGRPLRVEAAAGASTPWQMASAQPRAPRPTPLFPSRRRHRGVQIAGSAAMRSRRAHTR